MREKRSKAKKAYRSMQRWTAFDFQEFRELLLDSDELRYARAWALGDKNFRLSNLIQNEDAIRT